MPPETTVESTEETETLETQEETGTEETREETPAPTPDALARTEEIVREIREKVSTSKDAPSEAQIRAAVRAKIKAETGMSDAQIDYMDNRVVQIVAPLQAKTVFNEWKESKGAELTPEIEKGVKEYLKGYAPHQQADPTLLDNIFYMELGKATAKSKKAGVTRSTAETKTEQIVGRRIVPPTPPPATGLNGGSTAKTGASSLTKEELVIANKMRMTPDEYAAAKGDPTIARLKKNK